MKWVTKYISSEYNARAERRDKPQVQDIPWQIVNQKEILNPVLNTSITKSSDSFVTAKGSMPLPDKITILTGPKYNSDNHHEANAIKKT